MQNHHFRDYADAGYRIFQLHRHAGARCGCGNPACKSAGKHPRVKEWQKTPAHWDDDQIEVFADPEETGFGVCVDGRLVIDIDPRNGGDASYSRLMADTGINYKLTAGFVVRTGGGGWHIYYNAPAGVALKGKLSEYPGIDFKSTGYVVGAGSSHASGSEYELSRGFPGDETDAPAVILDLLKKPHSFRGESSGSVIDVDEAQLVSMLSCISPDVNYETWVQIGMALHHATQGAGIGIFDKWSSTGTKYAGFEEIDRKWHSFGRSTNPVTLGTIVHHAEEAGYVFPVSDHGIKWASGSSVRHETVTVDTETGEIIEESNGDAEPVEDSWDHEALPFDCANVAITSPPGFVGRVVDWINSNSLYHRKHLAVAAALVSVGNIAGLKYTSDDPKGVSANLFAFCVAGSATGKEAILSSALKLHQAAGIAVASHGKIKSEQEMMRNLVEHQPSYYLMDEVGGLFSKIANASKKGGASYLEGIVPLLMESYTKARGVLQITGDTGRELRDLYGKQIPAIRKHIESGAIDEDAGVRRIARIGTMIKMIETGLSRPFVSLFGATTPVSFDGLVTFEQATNGFISRAMIFRETETVPDLNRGFVESEVPMMMASKLLAIRGCVNPELTDGRIEYYGDMAKIPTTKDARGMLDSVFSWFRGSAKAIKGRGLESIPLRGYELVLKLSLILAIPGGLREAEHVRYAFVLVKKDIDAKIHLAHANNLEESKNTDDRAESLASRIISTVGTDEWMARSVLVQRCARGSFSKDQVADMVAVLVGDGDLMERDARRGAKQYRAK